ncbi:cellulase family glycosylhydrolase [uncultured Fibrobacter sp.]|uniref:cellulase family glycosylhydrolase n=1 Tax=uncultured Fibrobacter sp. TaxID=261512 RepID=UPI00262A38AE|nr:cellulase family glycosylhydrolase [uncultured Fibrobacter sp.]
MKISKLLPCALALAAIPAFASAADAVAKRIGPVSYYGALHTSGGKIIGSKNNQEAVLRGMSLFWSDATGLPYYNKTVISWATENLKMDVFRFAMGITYYDSDGGTSNKLDESYSYSGAPEGYTGVIDQMVEAAIENDIYIILDWHSHRADYETEIAKKFFAQVAEKYKDVPNVIFEIFNEPRQNQAWSSITGYAGQVIPGIRNHTKNLVLVGTPSWSQLDQYGGVSGENIGYVFHFYAGTHSTNTYSSRITQAKSSGSPVFITEWGTVNADGAGNADQSSTNSWMTFMDNNNISNCNWSLRHTQSAYSKDGKVETSAIFDGTENLNTVALLNGATYSESGKLVKAYLQKHARTWADSLVKGKNTGSCAFKTTTVKETDGTAPGVLKSGCTYVSSNESVATPSGSDIVIGKAGFAILTGSDNSQSVIVVSEVPKQTVPNLQEKLTCSYSGDCSNNRALKFSGGEYKEWILTSAENNKTLEGATYTLTSLNPDIVSVKTATCTASGCIASQKGKQQIMFEFRNFGEAKIVATAPAVNGFAALNDTVTVVWNKSPAKLANTFKNVTIALGGVAEKLLPDTTTAGAKITYTFNDSPTSPYVTQQGNNLVAGNQNAIVKVTATAPETDFTRALERSIVVVVGDSTQAVNKEEYNIAHIFKTAPTLPLRASIAGNMLSIGSQNAGDITVDVFSVNGQTIMSKTLRSEENASVSLAGLPTGSYLISIRQGIRQLNIRWSKSAR